MVDQVKLSRFIRESKTSDQAIAAILNYFGILLERNADPEFDEERAAIFGLLPSVFIQGHKKFGRGFIEDMFKGGDVIGTLNTVYLDGCPFSFLDTFEKIMNELNK